MQIAVRRRQNFQGLRQMAGASGWLLTGRIAGAAANFVFALILARTLSPSAVGSVFAVISAAFLASTLITLNAESGSIRFLVAARQARQEGSVIGFILFSRLLLLGLSPIVSSAFVLIASQNTNASHVTVILCAAASIPVIGWLRLSGAHATALGMPVRGSLPRTAVQPLLLPLLFLVALLTGASPTSELALVCFLSSFIVAAIVQFLLLRKLVPSHKNALRDYSGWRNWIANGFYLSPNMLLQDYLQHSIILAAAFALKSEELAVLGLSIRFISLIRFGILSINMAASPVISRAIAAKDNTLRDAHFRNAAILKAPPALLATAGIILFAGPFLSVFGPEYAGYGDALAWLALIPLSSALLGPNHMLLNISGARRWVFAVSLAAVACLFIATSTAAAYSDVTGAAKAASIIYIGWELALFLVARIKLGMDPSVLSIFRAT